MFWPNVFSRFEIWLTVWFVMHCSLVKEEEHLALAFRLYIHYTIQYYTLLYLSTVLNHTMLSSPDLGGENWTRCFGSEKKQTKQKTQKQIFHAIVPGFWGDFLYALPLRGHRRALTFRPSMGHSISCALLFYILHHTVLYFTILEYDTKLYKAIGLVYRALKSLYVWSV